MNTFKKHWWELVLLLIVAAVLIVLFLLQANKNQAEEQVQTAPSDQTTTDELQDDGQLLSHGLCKGDDKPNLTNLPMREQDFSSILPYGLVIGAHVTPIDHQYFAPADYNSERDAYPVYAMADATLVDIGPREKPEGTEYRLVFSMSCKLFYYYDLVTSLVPEITLESLGAQVTAGQLIGYIGGQTLDFAVWDMDVVLPGFVVPEHYRGEPWKIHTADPLNYYTDSLKEQVLAKYLRTPEPRSGKIDYDIDGRLIGNWFVEGTGGYAGAGTYRQDYYSTHLSIAPDYLDPTSIVFSIGDMEGEPQQFGVAGNAPDPAQVSTADGIVTYELVQEDWVDESGLLWDRTSFATGLQAANGTQVQGTALLQMIDDRRLKVEVFPGLAKEQVTGFTTAAKIYER